MASGPTGPERFGTGNPAELNQCVCPYAKPIDSYSGNFSHTFTDLQVPGRGLALDFTRTYNAGAANLNGPLGYGWADTYQGTLTFDGTGNATVLQENGSTVIFAPDGAGGFAAPSRVLASLVHNGDGTYTFTRRQDQSRFTFSASGQLLHEADRNGYTTTLSYDTGGHLAAVTDAAGRALSFSSDGSGRITGISDPLGRSIAFSYDGSGNLSAATDVNGGVWRFTYDANHLLLTMTDPRGAVTTNVYDSSSRVTRQTDALGHTTTFAYTAPDANGNSSTTVTDPKGNVTVDQYYNGLLLAHTRGFGTAQAATWNYTYDPISLGLVSTTDPNGNITSQTWDANGNLLSTTDPLGNTATYTYNSFNEVTSITDANGVTTTKSYDAQGNLLSVSTPLVGTSQTQTTSYAYSDASHPGDVTAMTDPNGKTWRYTYDANGDQTTQTDPLGDTTTSTYNAIGWPLTQVSPKGNVTGGTPADFTTSYQYDPFGDITLLTTPLGETTTSAYDADRNLTQVTDADGHVTQNTYDADNELTKATRADGSALTYVYDADGNHISQTDGLAHTTAYAYDPLNRVESLTDPLGRTTTYTYDGVGNRLTLTDPGGHVTTAAYDAADELVSLSYSDGTTPGVRYTYDALGQRLSMTDGTGTTAYTYDSLHRLTASTNGAGTAVAYGYALNGELTALIYPGGQVVTRAYDAAGRLTQVTDWLGHATTFSYDADGNLVRQVSPNAITGTLRYDHDDRLRSLVDVVMPPGPQGQPTPANPSVVLSLGYTRDGLGLLTAAGDSGVQVLTQPVAAYTYTALSQVSQVIQASSQTAYAYDHADDLTQAGGATLSYDVANELTGISQGGVTVAYAYNRRGDRTTATVTGGGSTTYGYDQANRLIRYTAGTTSAQYAYDGDGLRMRKTVGNVTTQDAWDVAEGLPLLLQDGTTAYVSGPGGLPLEQITASGQVFYYLHDAQGSTRVLADASGAVVATYRYDAYGQVTASSGTVTNPFQYAGQYADAESGLLYLRARYYEPTTGQFLTRDPLVLLTKAPYGYAGGDPLNRVDPSGKFALWDNALFGLGYGATSAIATLVTESTRGNLNWGDVAISAGAGFVGGFIGENCGPLAAECAGAITGVLNEAGDELAHGQQLDIGRIAGEGAYGALPGPFGVRYGDNLLTQELDQILYSELDPFALRDALGRADRYGAASCAGW